MNERLPFCWLHLHQLPHFARHFFIRCSHVHAKQFKLHNCSPIASHILSDTSHFQKTPLTSGLTPPSMYKPTIPSARCLNCLLSSSAALLQRCCKYHRLLRQQLRLPQSQTAPRSTQAWPTSAQTQAAQSVCKRRLCCVRHCPATWQTCPTALHPLKLPPGT